MLRKYRIQWLAPLLLGALIACGEDDAAPVVQAGGSSGAGGTGGLPSTQVDNNAARSGMGGGANGGADGLSAATLSDPEVLGVLDTVNTGEIEHAELAVPKTENQDVRSYAEQMIADHTASKLEAADLAESESITPAESSVSRALKAKADDAAESLSPLTGAEFDRAYIAGQVQMHGETLMLLDQALQTRGDSALGAFLTKTRGVVADHHELAQRISDEL